MGSLCRTREGVPEVPHTIHPIHPPLSSSLSAALSVDRLGEMSTNTHRTSSIEAIGGPTGAMRVILFDTMSQQIPSRATTSLDLRLKLNFASRLTRIALLIAVTAALQLGCAGTSFLPSLPTVGAAAPIPSLETVPAWALASTENSGSDRLVGIGSGETLDQATRYALSDVASRLSVSVESQLRDVYREVDGTSTASLEHVIETRVLGTQFRAWERTRSVEIMNVFWVEVQVDRKRLVRDSLAELHDAANEIDHRLRQGQGSALSRLIALQATAADRDHVSNLIALTDALHPTFNRDEWNRRRETWRTIDESARRALVFEVRSDPASQEIARWLESQLASEQLTTRPGSCLSGNSICIDIRSEVVEADIASRYVARIRSYFSILEPGGSLVREVDLSGRGNSSADPARARRRAMDDLRRNFESASILNSLIEP